MEALVRTALRLECQGLIPDRAVTACALGAIIIVGAIISGQYFLAGTVPQPFSELALLGPDGKIGNYTSSVAAGQNFTLDLYVGNHEGQVTYYRVYVKLGNISSVVDRNVSLSAPPIAVYDVFLKDSQNVVHPMTFQLSKVGAEQKLVFELWTFSPVKDAFAYAHSWNQIILNVTGSSQP